MFYDATPFTAANSGYRIAFRPGEANVCPGCGHDRADDCRMRFLRHRAADQKWRKLWRGYLPRQREVQAARRMKPSNVIPAQAGIHLPQRRRKRRSASPNGSPPSRG